MFLPPADALLPPHGVLFADHRAAEARAAGADSGADAFAGNSTDGRSQHARELAVGAAVSLLPSGCAGGRRFVRNLNSCGANKIYCWH
eukprot:3587966-Prymnesium_polylepis.1